MSIRCGRPLGGCYLVNVAKTEALGRLVTCHSLHCCAPGHIHKWVYWNQGTMRYLDSEETLEELARRRRGDGLGNV